MQKQFENSGLKRAARIEWPTLLWRLGHGGSVPFSIRADFRIAHHVGMRRFAFIASA